MIATAAWMMKVKIKLYSGYIVQIWRLYGKNLQNYETAKNAWLQ